MRENAAGGLATLHAGLLLLTVAPILAVDIPALGDYPNHLARLTILATLDAVPALQQNYEIVPTLTPYLLVDWILTPFVRLWGAYPVGRGFVAAAMAITYGGILSLSCAQFGRLTAWPAMALPLLYNYAFSWGFMNFSFGIGLMFWALRLWLHLQTRRIGIQVAFLLGAGAILYLTHMLAFGLFALIAGSHRLSAAWRSHGGRASALAREVAPVAIPLSLILAVYAVWSANDGMPGAKVTAYGSAVEKAATLVSPTMFSNSLPDWLLLAAYLVGAVFLIGRRKLRLADDMALPLVAFGVVCLLMPNTLLGVWGVDFRLPPVLLMLAVASTCPKTVSERPAPRLLVIGAIVLVVFRVATVWPQLDQADRQFAEFRSAIQEIAPGSSVLVSIDEPKGRLALPRRAYWNLALLAVIERSAFVPILFTGVTQVRPTEAVRDLDSATGDPLRSEDLLAGLDPQFIALNRNRVLDAYHRVYWADWPGHFDYLIRISPAELDPRIAARLGPVSRHSFFEIARILREP